MFLYPPTCIIRHRRENLKKCSLRGLEGNDGFSFFLYPNCISQLPVFPQYVLLDLDGEPLTQADSKAGLIVIDATWRLAQKMMQQLHGLHSLPKRSIPAGFITAYPRRQQDCKDPTAGLASIEALYIAYRILQRDATLLLDHYYWKEQFLQQFPLDS